MKFALEQGRRPHLLYGTRESVKKSPIKILEPLQNNSLATFNPINGSITKDSDRVKIKELMDALTPYLKEMVVGYSGEKNAAGKMHGEGKYVYDNGSEYIGSWKDGRQSGVGQLTFTNGSRYNGQFVSNKKHGKGVFTFATGERWCI